MAARYKFPIALRRGLPQERVDAHLGHHKGKGKREEEGKRRGFRSIGDSYRVHLDRGLDPQTKWLPTGKIMAF